MNKHELPPMPTFEKDENSVESVFETRVKIIDALNGMLEGHSKVIAAFVAGSDAQNRLDEYSDIDFDIIVEPESIDEVEVQVREALQKFSPIKTELKVVTGGGTTIIHQFEKISKFLHVDVLYLTNADKVNGAEVKVLFDKKGVIKPKERKEDEERERIKSRIEKIEKYRDLRTTYFERSLLRGNFLEAEDKYRDLILKSMIEVLRLQHCPSKSDYHTKHINSDLPAEIVMQIEGLIKVSSIEELREKSDKANEIINDTLIKLKSKYLSTSPTSSEGVN